jgi:hypothetical protein
MSQLKLMPDANYGYWKAILYLIHLADQAENEGDNNPDLGEDKTVIVDKGDERNPLDVNIAKPQPEQ